MRWRMTARAWLFPMLLGAFALRLYHLGADSLWYDETVSLFLARQDLASLTRHTAGDIHPPLYYYLLHFWGAFAGWSEFASAFLSLFFGVLLIALVYRAGRVWFDKGAALLAALLVAISPYNLWYSQEVRMYTLGAVLGLGSVFFFVQLMQELRTNLATFQVSGFRIRISRLTFHVSGSFLAYAVISVLGLYTLYYFAFLLVFENLVALFYLLRVTNFEFRPGIAAFIRHWLPSQLFMLVLYVPWLPVAYWQATNPPVPPWRSFTDLGTILLQSFSALALGQSVNWNDAPVALVLFLVALVLGYGLVRRSTGKKIPFQSVAPPTVTGYFLLGYTFIPVLTIFLLSFWKPLWHVRYLFIYSPGFYLLLAMGFVGIWNLGSRFMPQTPRPAGERGVYEDHRFASAFYASPVRWLAAGMLIVLAGASAYSDYNLWFNPEYATDDLRSAVQSIAENWRPGDAVLLDAGYTYTAFVYYYPAPVAWRGRLTDYWPHDASSGPVVVETGSIGGGANLGWGSPESDFYATTTEETRAALDRLFAAHPRVWLLRLYDTVVDPDGFIRDYLAQHGRLIQDQVFSGESNARVQGYLTSRAPLTQLPVGVTERPVLLGQRISLLGYQPAEMTVHAGQTLNATLYWQAVQPTNVDEHLFVGLYSTTGQLVAASSELPLGNALGTSRWSKDEIIRDPIRIDIPTGLALGDYRLHIAMYNPFTNEPLDPDKTPWTTQNGQIDLMDVHIR